MNDSALFERNDTGILSLADLFRRDRLPSRAEPRRRPAMAIGSPQAAHDPGMPLTRPAEPGNVPAS
jgi:hypothetical protein